MTTENASRKNTYGKREESQKNSSPTLTYGFMHRRKVAGYIAYGMLIIAVAVLLIPSICWIALIIPIVYSIREWFDAVPKCGKETKIFAPDPLGNDLTDFAEIMAESIEETAISPSEWLLCPLCSRENLLRYDLDYSFAKKKLIIRFKKQVNEIPIKTKLKIEASLPIMVYDRPHRIILQHRGDYAVLQSGNLPRYSWMYLPRFINLAVLYTVIIMIHFALAGTRFGDPVQQMFFAIVALFFPGKQKKLLPERILTIIYPS